MKKLFHELSFILRSFHFYGGPQLVKALPMDEFAHFKTFQDNSNFFERIDPLRLNAMIGDEPGFEPDESAAED